MGDFQSIFSPKSIAVVGASNTKGTVGHAVMYNLISGEFHGQIFPINPKPTHFEHLKSYSSVEAIDEPIDSAIIMVPAIVVPKVIETLGRKGVKSAVVISSGFKESGVEGAQLELEVGRIANHFGITLFGPNCIGVMNPQHHYNATFATTNGAVGTLSLVSQSGALGTALLDLANNMGIGLAKFATIGNKANLDELELIQYLASDSQTKVIALYMEAFTPHHNWVQVMRRITSGQNAKPIILLKSGVTLGGARAAISHTGAVAGNAAIYETFARQAGTLAVSSIESLMLTAQSLLRNPLPKSADIAVVTNAGGPGILATDRAEKLGISLWSPSASAAVKLQSAYASTSSVKNPIDLLGDANGDRYAKCLTALADESAVGGVVVIVTPQSMTDSQSIARALLAFRSQSSHVAMTVALVGGKTFDAARGILDEEGIAHTTYPESAIDMMFALTGVAENQRQKPPHYQTVAANVAGADKGIVSAIHREASVLSPDEAQLLLFAYNIPYARGRVAKNAIEAAKIAHSISGAVVLKIISPDILHKSDVGGVVLSITPKSASVAYRDIITTVKHALPHARIEGVLVQEMSGHGTEIIIGAKRDPVFGPAVVVGLGGIYVESLHDVAMRLVPISPDEARTMISELKSAAVLLGTRGQTGVDIVAMVNCIIKVAELMLNHPEISELDLNPISVGAPGQGLEVLDARIVLG